MSINNLFINTGPLNQKFYVQKYDGRYLYFNSKNSTPELQSFLRLKRRMRSINTKWNKFIDFTYNDLHLSDACANDIRKLINRFKQKYRNHKDYDKLNEIQYVWKVEFDSSGERKYHPHFHMLMYIPEFIPNDYLRNLWGKGFVHIEGIYSKKKAQIYVSKYFSKKTLEGYDWKERRWSQSRNIPKKSKSNWQYLFKTSLEIAIGLQKGLFTITDLKDYIGLFSDVSRSACKKYINFDFKEIIFN